MAEGWKECSSDMVESILAISFWKNRGRKLLMSVLGEDRSDKAFYELSLCIRDHDN
jgi:hypothetical protein